MQTITFPCVHEDVFVLVNKRGKILHSVYKPTVFFGPRYRGSQVVKEKAILVDKLSDDDLNANNEEGVWYSDDPEYMENLLYRHKDVLKGFKVVKVSIIRNTTFEFHN
jgi:hypothetical protein